MAIERARSGDPVEGSLRRRVTGVFIVAVLLTLFLAFSSWHSTWETANDADWVAHTYAVMETIEITTRHVIKVEPARERWA
jgi:CHASE3 domain sensor protein